MLVRDIKMKIFLTGSTGYVGGYVLESLLKDGYIVKCLVRKCSEEKLKGKKVEICYGDALDKNSLNFSDCDVVINLIGIIR